MSELAIFQLGAFVLHIALGSWLVICGTILAVPAFYRGAVRALRAFQERAARKARASMPPEDAARISAAAAQRRAVTVEPPQSVLSVTGVLMVAGGIIGSLGLLDFGTIISAIFVVFCVVICWWSIRARATRGERRVASLQPHTYPSWLNPVVLAIPLLEIPVIALAGGRTTDAAIIIFSIVLGTAVAYVYAKYADRALFGEDTRAESLVDDNMRGSTALLLSFICVTGPTIYLFERSLAMGGRMELMWLGLIVLYAFLAFSGRMLKKRRRAILEIGLDSPPRDVIA